MRFKHPPPGIFEKEAFTSKAWKTALSLVKTLNQSELQRLAPFHYRLLQTNKERDTRTAGRFESNFLAACALVLVKELQAQAEKCARLLNRAMAMQRPHLAKGVLLGLIQAFGNLRHLAERLQKSRLAGYQALLQRLFYAQHVLALFASILEKPEHPPPKPLDRQPKIQPNAPNVAA